jgi:uncharacterized membrane protein
MVRLVWITTLFLALIGIAVVARRVVFFLGPAPAAVSPRFSEGAAVDANFAPHAVLTMVHILPGLLFMVLGPLQFVPSLRRRRPALHRWMGRVFLVASLIVGVTALMMGPQLAIGGVNETVATMLFATLFLVSLGKAYVSIRRGRVAEHREWMIRAFAIGLAVATIRPIVGVFFATRRLTHLTPHDFFGTAFWLGFTLQAIVAEVWINVTRRSPAARPSLTS